MNYERKNWDSDGDTNILTNNGISESQWIGYRGGTNLYYDINAYNSIASDISFSGRNTPSKNSTNYLYLTNNNTVNIDLGKFYSHFLQYIPDGYPIDGQT